MLFFLTATHHRPTCLFLHTLPVWYHIFLFSSSILYFLLFILPLSLSVFSLLHACSYIHAHTHPLYIQMTRTFYAMLSFSCSHIQPYLVFLCDFIFLSLLFLSRFLLSRFLLSWFLLFLSFALLSIFSHSFLRLSVPSQVKVDLLQIPE